MNEEFFQTRGAITRRSPWFVGFCLSLYLLGNICASAGTYYVNSATGNDANSGDSPTTAWRGFTASIAKLASGDVLNCTGIWTNTTVFRTTTPNLTIRGGGDSTLVIRGSTATGTLVFAGDGLVLDGFNLRSPYTPTGEGHALIGVTGNNSRIINCTARDFAPITTYDAVIFYLSANSCIVSNLSFSNMADRDLFRVWGVGNLFTSCTFSNCTNPNSGNGPHADIFQTWWTGAAIWSNVVERCYFVNSSQATFQLKGTPDNRTCHPGEEGYWTIRNNVFNNCKAWPVISTDNFRFYNNLLYDCGLGNGPTFLIADPCLDHGRFFNNVFIRCTSTRGSNPTQGNNAFSSAGLAFGSSGEHFVTTEAACKFVNAAAGDFRLQEGSSLIGRGANLSNDGNMVRYDYDGNLRPATGAWDLGPFQYVARGAVNRPPMVTAGSDLQVYLPTNTVVLSGTATDPDGDALVLLWTQIEGPAPVTFSTIGAANTTATFPNSAGIYVLRLTASDGTNSAFADVRVTLNARLPPVVAILEAESGTVTAPFVVVGGSLSQPMETELSSGGRAVYRFSVPSSGVYALTAMVNAPGESADSFFINIDAEPADPFMIWDVSPLTVGPESRWVSWRGNGTFSSAEFNPKTFNLVAGEHSLIVVGREAGVSVDRFEVRLMNDLPQPPMNLRIAGPMAFREGDSDSGGMMAGGTNWVPSGWRGN